MREMHSTLRPPFRALLPVFAIGIAQAIILCAMILLIWSIIDELILAVRFAQPLGHVYLNVALLGVVALMNASLRGVEFRLSESIGYEVVRRLRMEMYGHLQGMAPGQIRHRSRGGLILRFTGDLTMFRTWISRGLVRGSIAACVVTGVAIALLILSPLLALTLLTFLLAGSALSLTVGRRLRRVTLSVRRARSALTSNIDEQLHSLAVVQVFGRAGGEFARLSRHNDALTRKLIREATQRAWLRALSSATGLLAPVAVIAVGVFEISNGRASLGLIIASVYATRVLTTPVRNIGLAHDYWQRAQVSRRKIMDFFASRSRSLDGPGLQRMRVRRARVEFDDVCVDGLLHGVTAIAAPGDVIAITGATGSGKSTLLATIARLVEPDSGAVRINGRPITEFTLRSMYRNIGMVSPDLPLLRGTVRRNLTYRAPRATPAEIARIAQLCRLDDIVPEARGGLDFWITEGGSNLSVGQRQRIALGRALMGNPPLLLLDEPTASLDDASRAIVHRVIRRHHGTTFLVTHDRSEARLADKVWVMAAGQLVETMTGAEYRERTRSVRPEGTSWRPAVV
jgi:ATP-binding cassette, subfamily B, bacterial